MPYVWGMVVAPAEEVLEHWGHLKTANKWRQFGPRTRPAGILRWLPRRLQERITADITGWTSMEDFAGAMRMGVPFKKQCRALNHPTGVWREMMHDQSPEDGCRFEGIWLKEDLIQLGIPAEILNTKSCIDLPIVMEATPVGIRAHSGTEFEQDLESSNVTWIP